MKSFPTRVKSSYEVTAIKLSFSKEDLEKEFAKEGYASMSLLPDGKLLLGYPSEKDPWYVTKIFLQPETKTLTVKMVGNKLLQKDQSILRLLKDRGMIDSGWKLRGQKSYNHDSDPKELEDFDFATDPRNRFSKRLLSTFKLYHGTTDLDYQRIQKTGLMSLDKSGGPYGFESRKKHTGNAGVLYLADSFDEALRYAEARARSLRERYKRDEGYEVVYDMDLPYVLKNRDKNTTVKIYPVVLEVTIPDIAKLVADDDIINEKAREIGRDIFSRMSADEIEHARQLVRKEHPDFRDLSDPSIVQMLWRDTDEGFNKIIQKVPDALYHQWFESLHRDGQVGYQGRIPPKFLKRLPTRYDDR